MFIFTGENINKLNVSTVTQCCKLYWINKTDLFIFVYSFVGNEDGTNQYIKICVFEYDVLIDNQSMYRKILSKLGVSGALICIISDICNS